MKGVVDTTIKILFVGSVIAVLFLLSINGRYSYQEKGMLRIDKWTGNIEVYKSNGVWEPY